MFNIRYRGDYGQYGLPTERIDSSVNDSKLPRLSARCRAHFKVSSVHLRAGLPKRWSSSTIANISIFNKWLSGILQM